LEFYSGALLIDTYSAIATYPSAKNSPLSEVFTFSPVADVDRIDLIVTSSLGGLSVIQLREVGFTGTTAVPEPSTGILLGLGLIGLTARKASR